MRALRRCPGLGAAMIVALALTACKEDETRSGKFAAVFDDFLEFICGCQVEAGYVGSVDECVSYGKAQWAGSDEAMYFDCIENFIDAHPSAQPAFDCGLSAYADYTSCQEAAGCEAFLGDDQDVQCADGSGEIPQSWVCDGFQDCEDNSDETDCATFDCGDGTTVATNDVCDQFEDCESGADEQDCPVTCDSAYQDALEACPQLSEADEAALSEQCTFPDGDPE